MEASLIIVAIAIEFKYYKQNSFPWITKQNKKKCYVFGKTPIP